MCDTLPRIEKKELAPLTDAQVKDFLQTSTGDSLEIIMKVILYTGMRESEALGLTWDCVDFDAGTVKICKQLQKRKLEDGGATLAPTKNGKSRTLKPAPFVMEGLYRDTGAGRLLRQGQAAGRRYGVHGGRDERLFRG